MTLLSVGCSEDYELDGGDSGLCLSWPIFENVGEDEYVLSYPGQSIEFEDLQPFDSNDVCMYPYVYFQASDLDKGNGVYVYRANKCDIFTLAQTDSGSFRLRIGDKAYKAQPRYPRYSLSWRVKDHKSDHVVLEFVYEEGKWIPSQKPSLP